MKWYWWVLIIVVILLIIQYVRHRAKVASLEPMQCSATNIGMFPFQKIVCKNQDGVIQ